LGNRYLLTITDSRSRWKTSHPIKLKSEAKTLIQAYINKRANEGRPVKILRTDNGGEFSNGDVKSLCESFGVSQQFTIAYNSQQNGIAERLNLTLFNAVRATLISANIPWSYWDEAIL
jgi:transposase InsO family protein